MLPTHNRKSSTEQLRHDLHEILSPQVGQQGNRSMFKKNIHKSMQGRPVSPTKPVASPTRPSGVHSPLSSPRDTHVVRPSTFRGNAPSVRCQTAQPLTSGRKDNTRSSRHRSNIQIVQDSDEEDDDDDDDGGEEDENEKKPSSKYITKLLAQSSAHANESTKLPIDSYSREHVEIKACLLTYMNRLNVEELLLLQQQAQEGLDQVKQQKMFYAGCTVDDGSLQQSVLHKTMFLLRHFFEIDQEPTKFNGPHSNDRQEHLLCDLVEDWKSSGYSNEDDIKSLWKSIKNHLEHTYILRKTLVNPRDAEPHELSVVIALDCLRKLTRHLPAYARVLTVIGWILENSIYLRDEAENATISQQYTASQASGPEQTQLKATEIPPRKRRLYFTEWKDLKSKLVAIGASSSSSASYNGNSSPTNCSSTSGASAAALRQSFSRRGSMRRDSQAGLMVQIHQKFFTVFDQVQELSDKQSLMKSFIRSNLELLSLTEWEELIFKGLLRLPTGTQANLSTISEAKKRRTTFAIHLAGLLSEEEATKLLVELSRSQLKAFTIFAQDNVDAVEKVLMLDKHVPSTTRTVGAFGSPSKPSSTISQTTRLPQNNVQDTYSPTQQLLQQLIERHPNLFSTVMCQSPFLTAQIFHESHHLVGRILEQNVYVVSQVLQHRPDVSLSLISHTLKDNGSVLEEYFSNHPNAFADVLINKPKLVAGAIKSHPVILADIVANCKPTLQHIFEITPEGLCALLKCSSELLGRVIRSDPSILQLAALVSPQYMSEMLEKHPEIFLDVAHRKPTLVTRLFTKHPDLLLEPLETNPMLFTNFLVLHRKYLPDLSDPNLMAEMVQFNTKKYVENASQTDKEIHSFMMGNVRLTVKLKRKQEELLARTKATAGVLLWEAQYQQQKTTQHQQQQQQQQSLITSSSQLIREISRLYVKKIQQDAQDDLDGIKRTCFADMVLDLYIQELGFKGLARKKLTTVILVSKKLEADQRIKWFRVFLGVDTSRSKGNPLALDCYLYLLARMIPLDQIQTKLDDEYRPAQIPPATVREIIEDMFVTAFPKEQRQQMLHELAEKDHNTSAPLNNSTDGTLAPSNSNTTIAASPSATNIQVKVENSSGYVIDEVMDVLMNAWVQAQETAQNEWITLFQRANRDGTGIISYKGFAEMIQSKSIVMDNRGITKLYHLCVEENELGEYHIVPDDFALLMTIMQERENLCQRMKQLLQTSSA